MHGKDGRVRWRGGSALLPSLSGSDMTAVDFYWLFLDEQIGALCLDRVKYAKTRWRISSVELLSGF